MALLLLLGLGALFAIDQSYRDQVHRENLRRLGGAGELVRQNLELGVGRIVLVAEALRAFLQASSELPDHESFDRYAAGVLSHSPDLRALEYADQDRIIRYVYPLEGNEAALGLDLMSRPAAPFVEEAIRTRNTTISNPEALVQGSLSLVVRAPLFDGDRFVGLAQSVADISALIESTSAKLPPGFAISLRDVGGDVFWKPDMPIGTSITSDVYVGRSNWQLTLGWAGPEPGPELYVLGLIWGLGGALLTSLLFIVLQMFRRMRWLADAVDEKTAELATSEARYRSLVETTDDPIALADLEFNITFCNKAFYSSLGFDAFEDAEFDNHARVHPEDRPDLQEELKELVNSGSVSVEYRVRHKDGNWLFRDARYKLVRDEKGTPRSILFIAHDVSERRRAQGAATFRARLLDMVQQAVIATDLDGTIHYWNRFAERLYGWPASEVLGRNVVDITSAKSTRGQAIELMSELKEGKSWTSELTMQRKDGSSFEALVTNSPNYDENGELTGIVGVSVDISERLLQQQELADAKILLEKTFASLSDAVFVINPADRTIVLCNQAVEEIFGYRADELTGKDTAILHIDQAAFDRFAEVGEPILQESGIFRTEFEMRHRDGRIINTENTVISLAEKDEWTTQYIVSVVRDITEQKQLEADRKILQNQFLQAQKMEAVGQLTAGIAHDFNNLLMAISGSAQLLDLQLDADHPLRPRVDAILQAADRAAELIRQLLIFSRKQVVIPQIVDLNLVIRQTCEMLQRVIGEHIEVALDLEPDLWPVKADPGQMDQIVANLAVNARDAMPEGGRLDLQTRNVSLDKRPAAGGADVPPGDYVRLKVSDSGIGMDQEVQSHLFEPFFTTKEPGQGTGLGLATVYGIVKQARGDIVVVSAQGKGSAFEVYLPRTTEVAAPSTEQPEKQIETGRGTILLVEDDTAVRNLALDVLKMRGFTVLAAAHGEEALQVVSDHGGPIDLLLTDVIMPGMSGKGLAEKIAERYPEIKTIYLSGYSGEAISQHGLLEPGINFLQKPVSIFDLVQKVREVLG